MGRILINAAACKTAWPHAEEPSLVLNNNVRAIICMHLIKDSANSFWLWTFGIEYSTSIPKEAQYTSKLFKVNSPSLSILMLFIGYSEKCVRKFIIYASKRAKAILRVDNKQTWDHLQDVSTKTIKYCHNDFPLDLEDHKNKWSSYRSFLYGCDRSPGYMFLN